MNKFYSVPFTSANLALILMLGASQAQADLVYYEPFADPAEAPPTGWTATNGSSGEVAGSLSYPGLAPSSGNHFGIEGAANYSSPTFTAMTGGETYFYSLLFRMDDLSSLSTTGHGSNLILLSPSTTISNGVASFGVVKDADNSSAYNLVFDGDFRGPSNSNSVKDPNLIEYTEGQTILLVGSYANGAGEANFWVNPDSSSFGAVSAPTPYVTDSANASRLVELILINSGTSTSTRPGFSLDEIRVGTSWADVTPANIPEPGETALLISGALLSVLWWRRRSRKQ